MSQAEALLNSLAEPEVEEDNVLVVDGLTRLIKIPSSVPNLGVENDGGVLRLRFRVPRYVGDADLSEFTTRINYSNARGGGDVYEVDDVQTVGDYLEFSWKVKRTATIFKGSTKFSVCMRMLDSDGLVLREFNTVPAILPVLEGLETTEQVVYEYADVLTQWHEQLIGAGDSSINRIEETFETKNSALITQSQNQQAQLNAVYATNNNLLRNSADVCLSEIETASDNALSAIEAKRVGSLASIPDDYSSVATKVDNFDRKKAEALIMSASGEQIFLDDSSYSPILGLNVYGKTSQYTTTGKNLFNNTAVTETRNGVTFTVHDDGSVTLKGTATATSYFGLGFFTLPNGDYILNGCTNGGGTTQLLYFQKTVDSSGYIQCTTADKAFTIADSDQRQMIIAAYSGATFNNVTLYPMIRKSTDTDDTYEPYTGGEASPSPDFPQRLESVDHPSVRLYGKNLMTITPGENVNSGITFTRNSDGSITLNGTTNGSATCMIDSGNPIPVKNYSLIASMSGSDGNVRMAVGYHRSDSTVKDTLALTVSSERELTFSDEAYTTRIYLHVAEAGTYNNLIVRPMLRVKEADSVYEEPRAVQTDTLTQTLHGIPVSQNGNYTDSSGQQWICDEVDFERGKYIQRVEEIDLTTITSWITWGVNYHKQGYTGFYHYSDYEIPIADMYCNILPFSVASWGGRDNGVSAATDYIQISLSNDRLADVSSNEAAIQSLKTLLADTNAKALIACNPIETDLTESELAYFRTVRSHSAVSTILNDHNTMMKVKYGADIKSYIPKGHDVILPKASWVASSDGTYHTQVASCTVRNNSDLRLKLQTTHEVSLLAHDVKLIAGNKNGTVTVYSIGDKPSIDLPVTIIEQRTERV